MTAHTKWQPCWKLTDPDHRTYGQCQWGPGVENPGGGPRSGLGGLCGPGYFHAYDNAYIALLMNPQHARIASPVLWQAEWRGAREDDHGLKFGATELRTLRVVPAPLITTHQWVAFAILCAAQVLDEARCPAWHDWAARWLTNEDRSAAATATAAATAAYTAANAAYAAHAAAYSAPDMLEAAIAWALTLEAS